MCHSVNEITEILYLSYIQKFPELKESCHIYGGCPNAIDIKCLQANVPESIADAIGNQLEYDCGLQLGPSKWANLQYNNGPAQVIPVLVVSIFEFIMKR